jgi:zinc protease
MNMKTMKSLSIFILALAFTAACATQERTVQPQSQPVDVEGLVFPELNTHVIPELTTFELDNGIKFYLVEDDEVPLINLRMNIRGGSFMVPGEKTGLHSIMTNAMRNGGSEAYPENELNQLLEDRAARIEFGMGLTSGSATLNALVEDFYDLLPVLVDVVMNPLLPEDKIELAIRQTRSSIARRNDNAQQVGFREFSKLIYGPDSPQARVTEHWTLDAINRDAIKEFHSQIYSGKNMSIGLVGDFKVDEIRPILEEVFSGIPAGVENELDFPEVDYDFEPEIYFVDKRDVNQSVILMGHIGGMRDNPDYAALQAMNEVLSGGFSGRLFQNVRSDQGLAYSVFGTYGSNALYPGQFYAGVFTRSEATGDAIEAVKREMIRLQEEPVSIEELEDTRNSILNSLVFRNVSRASVLNQRMNNDFLGLPADSFERYIEELREVTPEDIQRVAREYMRPGNMKILVVGHGGEIGDQLSRFGNVQEIDITIRRSQEEEEVIAGDAGGGSEWLNRMTEAILANGDLAGTFVQEGSVEMVTPMGAMNIDRSERINFREGTFFVEMKNTPQGDITFDVSPDGARVLVGGQEIPLPPAQAQQQIGEYLTHYLNILAHRDSYSAELMGTEEVNGSETVHLRLAW